MIPSNLRLTEQDKDEKKAKEAEEKEEKRLAKEKRKSQKPDALATTTTTSPTTTPASPDPAEEPVMTATSPTPIRTSMEDNTSTRLAETVAAAHHKDEPLSPTSGTPKVKNWLKNRFSRRASKVPKPETSEKESSSSFVGGAALSGASANNSTASLGKKSEVTSPKADDDGDEEERVGRSAKRRDSEGSGSVGGDIEEFQEARDEFDEDLAPPPTFPAGKSSSPARETKFVEQI